MADKKGGKAPLAERRWDAMSFGDQLAAVREVCGLRGSSLIDRFEDVLAVGAGFKKSAFNVTDRVCIGLLVRKKKKRVRGRKPPIPHRLLVTLVRDGRRIRLSIPTDVEELGDGRPHGFNAAEGIRAFNRNDPTQGVPGAACCVVVDQADPRNRFVLGCHHVLALSLLTSGCAVFKDTDVGTRAPTQKYGELFHALPMAADGAPCLDAAISLVDSNADIAWLSSEGIKPVTVEPGVNQPTNCFVFTPTGALPAMFVKEWANVPLQYESCGTVVIAAAYQFQAATVGGHSGSPVMSPDGTLHGMHFWGDPGQQMAMAIPAFMLFQSGRFPVKLALP